MPTARAKGSALSTHVMTNRWVMLSTHSGWSAPMSATAAPSPRTAAASAPVATTSTPNRVSRKGSRIAAHPSAGMTAMAMSPASLSWLVKPTPMIASTAPQVRNRLQPSTTPGWGAVTMKNGRITRYDDRWARKVPTAISSRSWPSMTGPATESTAVETRAPSTVEARKAR